MKYFSLPDVLSEMKVETFANRVSLLIPADGRISSIFGWRRDPIKGHVQFHNGLDFANIRGVGITAAAPGVVTHSGRMGRCGRTIVIDHGAGLETRYCHLDSLLARSSTYVEGSEVIGLIGRSGRATGPHLHFEVRIDGKPVDPAGWLGY